MNHLDTMKQALEALEYLQGIVDTERGPKAAAALRLAIEQAERQEPVAWTVAGQVTDWSRDFSAYRTQHYVRPVFATPPPEGKQEPVAWMENESFVDSDNLWDVRVTFNQDGNGTPLYTAPPQQQTQDPIAWGYVDRHGVIVDCITPEEHARAEGSYKVPLYAGPRQPLTKQQIAELFEDGLGFERAEVIARAIEAAHGIKGEA